MSGFRTAVTTALGLEETASLSDINAAWGRMLADEMTDEEKAALEAEKEKKRKEEEEAAAAGGEDQPMMGESLKTLRTVFKLGEQATLQDIVAAATKAPSDTALALEVKSLSERLAIAEEGAKEAQKLRVEAKATARDLFFSEQIRSGKMLPAEKDFFATSWDKDEAAVKKYFETKKPVVKLTERGVDLPGREFTDADPRMELTEQATKRAAEKSISFVDAMKQINAENPELAERVAGMYGPAGLARR